MSDRAHPEVLRVDGWSKPVGYSDVVSARGRLIVTAGMIGWNPADGAFESDDMADQAGQALRNVVGALAAAGAEPRDLVRLTWYVTSREEYVAARSAIGAHYRATIGNYYPAMSVVIVQGLLESRAKVEIEATAIVPDA